MFFIIQQDNVMKHLLIREKSIFIFLFCNLFFCVSSLSQINLCPFLAEGNVWTFCHVGYNHLTGEQLSLWFEKYEIQGTRKNGEREYKEIWVTIAKEMSYTYDFKNPEKPYISYPVHEVGEPRYFMSLREDNGRVFALVDEVNRLMGVPEGEMSKPVPQMYPYEGDEYEVYNFLENRSDKILPYIGDTVQFVVPNGLKVSDGVSWREYLNLFYQGGTLEYQSASFISDPFFPEVTAIHDLPIPPSSNSPASNSLSDLSGRPLSAPPAKGVFIQGGKKVVK